MNSNPKYFENLDGLRFFAFLSVFLFHSFYTPHQYVKNDILYQIPYLATRFGWLGVNFFFVLSGFLITYLILIEEKKMGQINLWHFYIRRILRIWPLYYLIVAFCFIVYPQIANSFADTPNDSLPNIWYFLLHISNLNYIYHPSDIPTLNILWSISIEEQYYLFWPLLLFLVKGKFRPFLMLIIILSAMLFVFSNKENSHYYHHHILACMSDLTIGGLCAYFAANNEKFIEFFENIPRFFIIFFYATLILYFSSLTLNIIHNNRIITAAMFAGVILEQNYSRHSVFKISRFKIITRLGKYTYGLYCYHYLALLLSIKISTYFGLNNSAFGVVIIDNLLGIIISICVAITSYHIFEKPFLKQKQKFALYSNLK